MHIFLTGPKQIGKSTIINKVIEGIRKEGLRIGGFCTYMGINNDLDIYINYLNQDKIYLSDNKVAYRTLQGATPIFQVFDTLGVRILSENNNDVIVMDELGFLETNAELFKSKVLSLLDGVKPIIGVVKEREIPWLDKVKYHPQVELITVSKVNRDSLPEIILNKIKPKY